MMRAVGSLVIAALRVGFPVAFSLAMLGGCASTPTPEAKAKADMKAVASDTTPAHLAAAGDAAASVGDWTRAEQYYVLAMKAGAPAKPIVEKLLRVCVADGRYPVALNYAEDYLRLHPRDLDVRYAAGTMRAAMGDAPHAARDLEAVVAARPDDADAHFALATVLRDAGKDQDAADFHFREYLRIKPQGPYAEAAMASIAQSAAAKLAPSPPPTAAPAPAAPPVKQP